MTTDTPDSRLLAWGNVAVLVLAQAILGAQLSMVFITAGLAGAMIAPNPCFATLPVSMVMLGSAISARFLSSFMARHGRGLVCLALTKARVDQLGLSPMRRSGASRMETAFTVSIEARDGVTTGIPAADRALATGTAAALVLWASGVLLVRRGRG